MRGRDSCRHRGGVAAASHACGCDERCLLAEASNSRAFCPASSQTDSGSAVDACICADEAYAADASACNTGPVAACYACRYAACYADHAAARHSSRSVGGAASETDTACTDGRSTDIGACGDTSSAIVRHVSDAGNSDFVGGAGSVHAVICTGPASCVGTSSDQPVPCARSEPSRKKTGESARLRHGRLLSCKARGRTRKGNPQGALQGRDQEELRGVCRAGRRGLRALDHALPGITQRSAWRWQKNFLRASNGMAESNGERGRALASAAERLAEVRRYL